MLLLFGCGQEYNKINYNDQNYTQRAWDKTKFPILIHIPNDLTEYYTQFENASNRWNLALGFNAIEIVYYDINNKNPDNLYDSLMDNINGIYKVTNFSKYPTQSVYTLATTISMVKGPNIVEADILFNFGQYAFDDYDSHPFSNNYLDFESVLTHELGHLLGLSHVEFEQDPFSIMNPTINKATKKRDLSFDDISKIQTLYK